MSNELITLLLAAAPISELRGALPIAISVFKMPIFGSYWLSVLGNMLPVLPLIFFWHYLADFLRKRFKIWDSFFSWLFERTRVRYQDKVNKYGIVGLLILVAIPLPATGAWTATVAAFVFNLPLGKSFFAILLGVMVAGLVVLSLTLGVGVFI